MKCGVIHFCATSIKRDRSGMIFFISIPSLFSNELNILHLRFCSMFQDTHFQASGINNTLTSLVRADLWSHLYHQQFLPSLHDCFLLHWLYHSVSKAFLILLVLNNNSFYYSYCAFLFFYTAFVKIQNMDCLGNVM